LFLNRSWCHKFWFVSRCDWLSDFFCLFLSSGGSSKGFLLRNPLFFTLFKLLSPDFCLSLPFLRFSASLSANLLFLTLDSLAFFLCCFSLSHIFFIFPCLGSVPLVLLKSFVFFISLVVFQVALNLSTIEIIFQTHLYYSFVLKNR